MKKNESTFGMNPQHLDKLLAMGLDSEIDEITPTTPIDQLIERPGGQVGRYKLLRTLGEGGMGIVFLAKQQEPVRRQVALKVIKPGMDSKRVIARFEAEQQALALMDHPHVAQVYDAGLAPSGRPFFVMEHVKGISITEYCDRHKLTIEERLRLFLHVLEAVQHAHQKGIIHRDLKPSNILVVVKDKEAVPKVIDFGVARAISQPLTKRTLYTEVGQLIGTPEYMSPEQADLNNQDIDTRTDIYSLGVVLYELLVGMLPFDQKTFRDVGIDHIRKVICEEDPMAPSTRLSKMSPQESAKSAGQRRTDLRTLRRKVHSDLDWITLKAIEKNRRRRYATVEAFTGDIRHHLNHEPVSAAPPGLGYTMKKLIRRHQREAMVATMVAFILIGAAIAAAMYLRIRKEQDRVNSLEHRQRWAEVLEAFSARNFDNLNDSLVDLLDSPHVGRKAKLLYGRLLLEQEGPVAAVPELESLLDVSDEVAGQAHLLLANIYYESDPCGPGKTEEYYRRWEEHRKQAERLIIGTASYYFLRAQAAHDIQQMLEMLGKTLQLDKQHYAALWERAHIYYAQHDHEKMEHDAARMKGVQPNNPQGYFLSATALREQGRLDEAIQDYSDAILLAPDNPEYYDGRRETYTRMSRYELALNDAKECLEMKPDDLTYRHKLFSAFTLLGLYDQAEEQYARFMSYPKRQEYNAISQAANLKLIFHLFSGKLVADSLAAGRPWHPPNEPPPHNAPYGRMYEADAYYRELMSSMAKRLVTQGFHPTWSPDGTKLAYSQGLLSRSTVAIRDLQTQRTELVTTAGKNPEWSPDGRYITFVKNRRLLPPAHFTGLNIRTLKLGWSTQTQIDEVWVIDIITREIWCVGEGACPHWGQQSDRLYYYSRKDNTLYSVGIRSQNEPPTRVLSNCHGSHPRVSPDERHVADCAFRELKIIDMVSENVVTSWITPPAPRSELGIGWHPSGHELSIAGSLSSEIGLWIYDTRTNGVSKVLGGPVTQAIWSPDGDKLAISFGAPYGEIWLIGVKPVRPTVESFDSVQTVRKHCVESVNKFNRRIEADSVFPDAYNLRADFALWIGHEKTNEYLEQFDQALTTYRPGYNAAACAIKAEQILKCMPRLRDRLLPLALLLARKAVEKEPENPEYLGTLGAALFYTEKWRDAEAALLKVFDSNVDASDTHNRRTVEVVPLLVQLYEAWGKSEKAEEWRAKLAKIEDFEE